jgi:peptidoglycan-associated lipoprotein
MHSKRWMLVVMMGLVCAVAITGCKKRPKGAGLGGDNIGGVGGSDVYGEGLSDRPEGGTEVAGQFSAVYFDYDSAQINESERSKIESVASSMKGGSGQVIVEGNCDERGSTEYNLALGERRALAVRAYLVGLGVDGARIQTKSYGEERPVDPGHEEGAWSKNRRAEFVVVQ